MILCMMYNLTFMETKWLLAVQTKKLKYGIRFIKRRNRIQTLSGNVNKHSLVRDIQGLYGELHGLTQSLEIMEYLLLVVMINKSLYGVRQKLILIYKIKLNSGKRKLTLFKKIRHKI